MAHIAQRRTSSAIALLDEPGASIRSRIPGRDAPAAHAAASRYPWIGRISERLRRAGIEPEARFVPGQPRDESKQ